jgi:hypothetical protein
MKKYTAVLALAVAALAWAAPALASTGSNTFTYQAQTVNLGEQGNAAGNKLQVFVNPNQPTCAPDSLVAGEKQDDLSGTSRTFTAPDGSILVAVSIHSGIDYHVVSQTWAEDNSSATIVISKDYSNAVPVYCTAATTDENPPPTTPQCPEGYTSAGMSGDVLLCTKETVVTQTVFGTPTCPSGTSPEGPAVDGAIVCDKVITNTVTNTVTQTVFGTPTCPSGSTQIGSGQGTVTCQVTKVQIQTKTVVKNHTKVVVRTKVRTRTKIIVRKALHLKPPVKAAAPFTK